MNINLDFLPQQMKGTAVRKPFSGALAGHAAGGPFDQKVYEAVKARYRFETYRQFEYLNRLYLNNPGAVSVEDRRRLIPTRALRLLLNRGEAPTKKWSPKNLFEEKQNDTADILVVKDGFYNLLDVKTFNVSKNGQPPNIISALKLANMCALMLEDGDFSRHDITYIEIFWEIQGQELICTRAEIRELFKAEPSGLYINWAAAMQIQFHVSSLPQNYKRPVKSWCKDYLLAFTEQAQARADKMVRDFVEPFKKYL